MLDGMSSEVTYRFPIHFAYKNFETVSVPSGAKLPNRQLKGIVIEEEPSLSKLKKFQNYGHGRSSKWHTDFSNISHSKHATIEKLTKTTILWRNYSIRNRHSKGIGKEKGVIYFENWFFWKPRLGMSTKWYIDVIVTTIFELKKGFLTYLETIFSKQFQHRSSRVFS